MNPRAFPDRLSRANHASQHRRSASFQEHIMTIPTMQYRGHELRAYSNQIYPLYRDPYAGGPKQFSAVVRIDTVPQSDEHGHRYTVLFDQTIPSSADDATSCALQYGKDIIDGKVRAIAL
jgi:hypothetical protein